MKLGILGLGKMGQALAVGLLKSNKYSGIYFYDPSDLVIKQKSGVALKNLTRVSTALGLEKQSDILLLCVKPQEMLSALKSLKGDKKYISIAAGVSISSLCNWLNASSSQLARVMPNIAVLIAQSVNAIYCENEELSQECEEIFNLLGNNFMVKNEEELHAYTAMSGSGPALVCSFIEAFAKGGTSLGLGQELSMSLTLETINATLKLIKEKSISPSELRSQITSPAGTTLSALQEWGKRGLTDGMMLAIQAAAKRSRELSQD